MSKRRISDAEKKRKKAEYNRLYRERNKKQSEKKTNKNITKPATSSPNQPITVKSLTLKNQLDNRYNFVLALMDNSLSYITILKDRGEFVMQGDSLQRFSANELKAIADKCSELNQHPPTITASTDSKIDDDEYDDEEEED